MQSATARCARRCGTAVGRSERAEGTARPTIICITVGVSARAIAYGLSLCRAGLATSGVGAGSTTASRYSALLAAATTVVGVRHSVHATSGIARDKARFVASVHALSVVAAGSAGLDSTLFAAPAAIVNVAAKRHVTWSADVSGLLRLKRQATRLCTSLHFLRAVPWHWGFSHCSKAICTGRLVQYQVTES